MRKKHAPSDVRQTKGQKYMYEILSSLRKLTKTKKFTSTSSGLNFWQNLDFTHFDDTQASPNL